MKIFVGTTLPIKAESNTQGITLTSKQSNSSIVTAKGFFIVTPSKPAVTTAEQNATSRPVSIPIPKPILTPQKITGKK